MKTSQFLSAALLAGLVAFHAAGASLTYTSKAAFTNDLKPGFFLNDFLSLEPSIDPYYDLGFTNGTPAVSYVMTATNGLFHDISPSSFIGNWQAVDPIFVTFPSGNVRTIGGDFFLLNLTSERVAGAVTLWFSDGTTASIPSTISGDYGFFGISSETPIAAMVISNALSFINVGNFYTSAHYSGVPRPAITGIVRAGTTVTIDFTTVDPTATTNSFALQGATSGTGPYTDVGDAVVSQLPSSAFRAVTTSSAPAQSYRIRVK